MTGRPGHAPSALMHYGVEASSPVSFLLKIPEKHKNNYNIRYFINNLLYEYTICVIPLNDHFRLTTIPILLLLIILSFNYLLTLAFIDFGIRPLRYSKLRSTQGQDRMSNLALIHCHRDVARTVLQLPVLMKFVSKNQVRRNMFMDAKSEEK